MQSLEALEPEKQIEALRNVDRVSFLLNLSKEEFQNLALETIRFYFRHDWFYTKYLCKKLQFGDCVKPLGLHLESWYDDRLFKRTVFTLSGLARRGLLEKWGKRHYRLKEDSR